MSGRNSIEARVAQGVMALAVGASLLGCRGWRNEKRDESKARESDAVKEGSSLCDNDQIFLLGQKIALGENPDGDYTVTLVVGKSPSLRTFSLVLDLEDGTRFSPAGGSLPKPGETVTTGWGSYIEVEIASCGIFYHYEVKRLAGAEARPVEDLSCIPTDYAKEGLKPWPFVDHESVYSKGVEEVLLTSASAPEIFLVRLRDGVMEEYVSVERPRVGEAATTGSITVAGGRVTVEIVNCSGNYFFKSEFHPTVVPLPPGWIDWQ